MNTKNPFAIFVRHPYISALIVFLLSLLVFTSMMLYEANRLKSLRQYNALTELLAIKARLESAMLSHSMMLWGLHTNFVLEPDISQEKFEMLAEGLLNHGTQMQGLAWIPAKPETGMPNYSQQKSYGFEMVNIADSQLAIDNAIEENQLVLSGPVFEVGGAVQLFAFLPVYQDELFLGIVAGAIDHRAMLSYAGVDSPNLPDAIGLRWLAADGGPAQVFYGKPEVFGLSSVQLNIDLPYGRWLVAVDVDSGGWASSGFRMVTAAILSLTLAFLLGLAAYVVVRSYARREDAIRSATYRANYDALTGLINRNFFSNQLQQAINRHSRLRSQFSLMFIDLDYFKQVNDTWGHSAGDKLLQELADRLMSFVRKSDVVARLAGDEFVVLMNDAESATQVDVLANRILEYLSLPYEIAGQKLSISCSIGIAVFPDDGNTAEMILSHSDTAMYAAKKSGRNRVTFFNESMRDEAQYQLLLHNEILNGIEENEFLVYYQPIMELGTGNLCKCEALIRWRHPTRGFVEPGEFISVAESTGAIRPLGRWVLEQVCQDVKRWQLEGLDVSVSINRSVSEFYPAGSHRAWVDLVLSYGISPDKIIFEITESLFMDGNDSPASELKEMRSSGFRFAIDDFGTGYSAINYLRTYPVDFIKIDKSFVFDILTNEQDKTLVEVIIKMGKAMSIGVIAEGVEDADQLQALADFDCDFIQGYYLAKPMPLDQFIQFAFSHSWPLRLEPERVAQVLE